MNRQFEAPLPLSNIQKTSFHNYNSSKLFDYEKEITDFRNKTVLDPDHFHHEQTVKKHYITIAYHPNYVNRNLT